MNAWHLLIAAGIALGIVITFGLIGMYIIFNEEEMY